MPQGSLLTSIVRYPDGTFSDGNSYADEHCTTLFAVQPASTCEKKLRYLYVERFDSCQSNTWESTKSGAQVQPTHVYQWDDHARCAPKTPRADNVYLQVGDQVDPGALALATVETIDTSSRLQPRAFVGSDGSRQTVGWLDTQLKSNARLRWPKTRKPDASRLQRSLANYSRPLHTPVDAVVVVQRGLLAIHPADRADRMRLALCNLQTGHGCSSGIGIDDGYSGKCASGWPHIVRLDVFLPRRGSARIAVRRTDHHMAGNRPTSRRASRQSRGD